MSMTLDSTAVADLAGQVSGAILGAQDAGYKEARAVHNGLIDRRPALIVRCRIPGGGHHVAGRAVTDGGLMVDLAEMKGIGVDRDRATATAEGGVLWAELNDAAAQYGLAVTGGVVSTTGVAGLTLGGGNFGIATSFTYRLHPLQTIVGGLIAHPIEVAADLLRFYRDAVAGISDDLTVGASKTAVPHREEGWNLLLPSVWTDPADTEANIAWTRRTFAMRPHLGADRWLNYLRDDQAEAVRAAYGPNYERLREVKARYDPGNVFHVNHNIAP